MEKKKDKINFEDNIKKLETIVRELESGDVALDDALDKFNEAFKISKECDDKLKEVTESLNKVLNKDGNLEEFKIEESLCNNGKYVKLLNTFFFYVKIYL